MDQDSELYETMFKVFLGLKRDFLGTHLGQSDETLSRVQLAVLGHLGHARAEGGRRCSELAAGLHVAKPQMTLILDSLEELGLVARRRDEQDRRATSVELTARGEERLELGRRRGRESMERRMAALDAAERVELATSLSTLARLLEKIESAESPSGFRTGSEQ